MESELAPPAPVEECRQTSGISTCEREFQLVGVGTAKTSSFDSGEELCPLSMTKSESLNNPSVKKAKKKLIKQTHDILTPLSIPLTICYSLRSSIGDGSTRQRNSHALMERRSLRPNGTHLDVSHWSHRGKRSYMEGRCSIFSLCISMISAF
jgi:hypothetical protein